MGFFESDYIEFTSKYAIKIDIVDLCESCRLYPLPIGIHSKCQSGELTIRNPFLGIVRTDVNFETRRRKGGR